MPIVHRIFQRLAFSLALAAIGIVSPAAAHTQGASIGFNPVQPTAGQRVTITVHFGLECQGGRLTLGDGSADAVVGGTNMNVVVQHVYASGGMYTLSTYYKKGSVAPALGLDAKLTVNCKGGPATFQVLGAGKPSPAPGSVTCADGTVTNAVPGACLNHGGAKCADGTVGSGQGACKDHGGLLATASAHPPAPPNVPPNTPNAPPNTPNAPPPAPNTNTTGGGVTCNDGAVSNTQGKGACKDHHGILRPTPQPCNDGTMSINTADLGCAHHGGFKNASGTPSAPPAPPPAPPSPNTNTTGAMCSDGTVSSTTGKGACAHHGGIKKDSTPNAPPGAR